MSDLEQKLVESLRRSSSTVQITEVPLDQIRRRIASRRKRAAGVLTVAAVSVLIAGTLLIGGTALRREPVQQGATSPADTSLRGQTTTPAAPSTESWPTRGDLRGDASAVTTLQAQAIRDVATFSGGANATASITYLGDTPAGRFAVATVSAYPAEAPYVLVYWGASGSDPSDLSLVGDMGQKLGKAVSVIVHNDKSWWIFAVTDPRSTSFELSTSPVFTQDGTVSRTWSPQILTEPGVLVVPTSYDAIAAMIRFQTPDGQVQLPVQAGADDINDPSFTFLKPSSPVSTQLPPDSRSLGVDVQSLRWLTHQIERVSGTSPVEQHFSIAWKDPEKRTDYLADVRLASGGRVLVLTWRTNDQQQWAISPTRVGDPALPFVALPNLNPTRLLVLTSAFNQSTELRIQGVQQSRTVKLTAGINDLNFDDGKLGELQTVVLLGEAASTTPIELALQRYSDPLLLSSTG